MGFALRNDPVPVPVRVTVWGEPMASWATVTVPGTVANVVGLKTTLIVQV